MDRNVGAWALCFDWIYNALDATQRSNLIEKIAQAANIDGRAAWIRAGNADIKETFHREEWIFRAWQAWPEVALAGHYTDAEFCYQSRWKSNWYWGDAARVYAYLNDGAPLEGYQYGADATSWFMVLKSATGINLIDGPALHYDKSAADYQLYGTDFGLNRNVFHHGIGIGAGGLWTYTDMTGTENNWKIKEYHSMATQLTASSNPYQQWIAKNILTMDKRGASSWIFSNENYSYWSNFEAIATLLFYNANLPTTDPKTATYQALPFAKHFDGGNEVYMRSSWGDNASMACLRVSPDFTKTSHGDFDANTFLLYRKGNLSADTGVYDATQGQYNTVWYQKNTVAHNNILIVDPASPDGPLKLSAAPDPGGTESTVTYNFQTNSPSFPNRLTQTYVHRAAAQWGDITAFKTNESFNYAVGEASTAYGTRLNEYSRSTMFIRKPGDKAYFLVYDRINATNSAFKKKWLLHTVEEPTLNGATISTEVADHIYTTDGDTYSAVNAFNNSALYGKVLLPQIKQIRKVGGGGYEFWVDGTEPKNIGIDWTALALDKETNMGGPLKEIGQWRLELMPSTQQQRDLFLNVIYLGDTGETPADSVLATCTDATRVVVFVPDATKNEIVVLNKSPVGTRSSSFFYTYTPTTGQTEHILTELPPGSGTVATVKKNGTALPTSPITASANGTVTFVTDDIIGQSITISVSTTGDVETCSPANLLLCLDAPACDGAGGIWWPIANKCDSYAEPVASQGATIRGVSGETRKVNGHMLGIK